MSPRESCDLHVHSILSPCVNGQTTTEYLTDHPLYVPEEWTDADQS